MMNRSILFDCHLPATASTEVRDENIAGLWWNTLVGDSLVTMLSLILAFVFRFQFLPSYEKELLVGDYLIHFIFGVITLVIIQFVRGMYQRVNLLNRRENILSSFASVMLWIPVFLGSALILDLQPSISRVFALLGGGILAFLLPLWRLMQTNLLVKDGVFESLRKNVLVVGWNEQLDHLLSNCLKNPRSPFRISTCMPDHKEEFASPPPKNLSRLPSFASLESALKSGRFDLLIVSDLELSPDQLLELNRLCGREMVQLMILPSFLNVFYSSLEIRTVGSVPLMGVGMLPLQQPVNQTMKRFVDICGGLAGLILFAPVIALFAYLVYRESPGPVFYKQLRVGKDGRLFDIIKIRSMRLNADKEHKGFSRENDPRRLKIGALMRRLNIDELPQFWNVLHGEMSLVGPRPERPELIKEFKDDINFYNMRHSVKPGITGWAQINGWRGNTDLVPRIQHDLEYMEKWNPWLDLYILLKTPFAHHNAY